MRRNPIVPTYLLVPLEGPLTFKVNANLRPKGPSIGMVCKHCGACADAFGRYETCTPFNAPMSKSRQIGIGYRHEWIEPPPVNETDEELRTRLRNSFPVSSVGLGHPDYCSRCDGACRGHE